MIVIAKVMAITSKSMDFKRAHKELVIGMNGKCNSYYLTYMNYNTEINEH